MRSPGVDGLVERVKEFLHQSVIAGCSHRIRVTVLEKAVDVFIDGGAANKRIEVIDVAPEARLPTYDYEPLG